MKGNRGRIPLLERDQVPAEVAEVYDALLKARGVVPNMFKTLAYTPPLALGIARFLSGLLGDTALPGWYKELIASRISVLNDCEYAIAAHTLSARQKGARAEQIGGIHDPAFGPYTEREKLGFECAERIHRGPEAVDDEFFAKLKQHFSTPELVELMATASTFEFFTRFVDSMRISTTPAAATTNEQQRGSK